MSTKIEVFFPQNPKQGYGKGIEAIRSHAVLQLPEIAPYLKSQESTHEANILLQELLGPGQVRLPILRDVIRHLKCWFPAIPPCPRDFLRVWAGCVYYLVKHSASVRLAKEQGLLADVVPSPPAMGSSETEISSPSDWESGLVDNSARMPGIPMIPTFRARLPGISQLVPDDLHLMPLFA
jgi:hypothetical protein